MKLLIELSEDYILELEDVTNLNVMDTLTFCNIVNESSIHPILLQMVKDGILNSFDIQKEYIRLSIRTKYVKEILEDEIQIRHSCCIDFYDKFTKIMTGDEEECPFKQEAKQVYLKLQEDAFDYNLEFELSSFIINNLGMCIFELDRQFRNKYDIQGVDKIIL